VVKRKRDELEKEREVGQVDEAKLNMLKREVKLENEVEFELKTLNLQEVKLGMKGKNTMSYHDISNDNNTEPEPDNNNKTKPKKIAPKLGKKDIKTPAKIAISSTLDKANTNLKKEVAPDTP